ncbi:ATP-binding protein [Cupriavidus taiwanensis]|uniref:ATP synthase beta subunit/transription termination factor rho n=1 Tax=Cupriavidus taiwanensis TaxID=164546 RepID=A0A7Z7JFB4_9BURK|nr:adenylate/guanylate cyclase domain-containing protein [Cupriavidus taiwanensis]SOZ17144.1 ATP synthase beta subunit/transription termination factor rho [Cupriavidus taiwanensis]SOZ96191.1 ATP synthase beta subunit/transription termination factor rho [Cupriavidus taiwanensis]SPC25526.1 ATP synthase beta subunit/transription termination factor rho [Cupriavidus taiwanensis]
MAHCTICGFQNTLGAAFCEQCGRKLARFCTCCGCELSSIARFCIACGAPVCDPLSSGSANPTDFAPPHLAERILAEHAALESWGTRLGERKTITALFADMTASTALIHDRDPEEAHRLITPVIELMMEAVHHYEGFVAKSLGDGILALFGAPMAHEDHPSRALYAALRMQEAIRRHSDQLRLEQGISLKIRVGVHSGEVVVRPIRKNSLTADYDPVGQTVHIASRMEAIAAPSSILVSDATHKLTEGYFVFNALGATQIKGIPEPMPVFELLRVGPLRTRLQVAAHRGFTLFVGRKIEIGRLQEALQRTRSEKGQIVAVVGEAGVGKSRLLHEFKVSSLDSLLVLETFSVSHGKAFAYLPLIELLKNYFQITAQDDEQMCREKVRSKVLILEHSLVEILPYLLHLLGINEDGSSLADMGASLRRERTFDAIARLLICESRNRLVELLFEDMQWLDSETEAFLAYFIERITNARVLLLLSYRSEYQLAWCQRENYTELRLEPLGPVDAKAMLDVMMGADPALGPLKQLTLEKTEGNPFFMEEVVQTLAEDKTLLGEPGSYRITATLAGLHIPTTVQGVLAARMDRLPCAERELLQTLAIVGAEFTLSLAQRVSEQPVARLDSLLMVLRARGFIYESQTSPEIGYAFKHALTQEVAGNSLLSEERGALHERTGRAIEVLFSRQLKDHCNELAHHYSLSGNLPKAVEYLHCAGRKAVDHSAHRDAIAYLSKALTMVPRLVDPKERVRQELALRVTLGQALIAARGFAATEVEENYTRALALCASEAAPSKLFQVKLGLRTFLLIRAQHEKAYELGSELLSLAENTRNPVWLGQAHVALGGASLFLGKFRIARTHLEQGLAYYESEQNHAALYGQDLGVRGISFLARSLWYLGYPTQAGKKSLEALALARKVSHPISLALALVYAAELHQYRNEPHLTRQLADAAIALSAERGFPFWLAWGTILQGWAMAEQGNIGEGIAKIQHGLADYRDTGAEFELPYFLALAAQVYDKAGKTQLGLDALADALTMASSKEERYFEAELHRLKGNLLLPRSSLHGMPPNCEASKQCFYRAIKIARQQNAKSLELRALFSLARLLQHKGESKSVQHTLARLLAGFTEGDDSADWQQAKDLLEREACHRESRMAHSNRAR